MAQPIKKGYEVLVTEIPLCDFCTEKNIKTNARYDGKTRYGLWAHMCMKHFQMYGMGTGVGLGQKLIRRKE